ncbi:hypothetical protein MMC13_003312 [Lambiella insularis]|nr:hypothetical protein [Lambiella insularis]
MLPLSKPYLVETQLEYVKDVLQSGSLTGRGPYSKKCEQWLERDMPDGKAFLTKSGTAALEMAAILADIKPGDEVILPSFTFASTANGFVLRGAVPVFVDILEETMNMDVSKVAAAITPATRAIVPVHYAGVSCDMDSIMDLAHRHRLMVIEDAAQGSMSSYKSRALGTIGHIGCISFHETKNFTSGGQGGALLVNDATLSDRADVIYEMGTNRVQFLKGRAEQYEWQSVGKNTIMPEVLAALLWSQLEIAVQIDDKRHMLWNSYAHKLAPLEKAGHIILPFVPKECQHNAHIFYVRLRDATQRKPLVNFMRTLAITVAPHYLPLHSAFAGRKMGRISGLDVHTTAASSQLLRLPLYYSMSDKDIDRVVVAMNCFWN